MLNDSSSGAYSAVFTGGWSGTSAMTALNDALFITRAAQLWAVDPVSGSGTLLPSTRGDWAGPISMIAIP